MAAKAKRHPISIGVEANAADVFPALLAQGVEVDIVTDQTSAHDPLYGYIPSGYDLEEAARLREKDPTPTSRRPRVDGRPVRGDGGLPEAPAPRCSTTGTTCGARRCSGGTPTPSPTRASSRPTSATCSAEGIGAVPLDRPLRRPGRHRCHRQGGLSAVPRTTWHWQRWLQMASEKVAFQGLARPHLLARVRGTAPGRPRFNDLVARACVGADRDRPGPPRLGIGGVAVSGDRGHARRIGRHRRLAHPQRHAQHRIGGCLGRRPPRRAGSGSATRSTPAPRWWPTAPRWGRFASSGCSPTIPAPGSCATSTPGIRARSKSRRSAVCGSRWRNEL
jgi:hypothetical protein